MSKSLDGDATVAGFQIDHVIGEGATGTVYLAHEPGGRRVALKVLSPRLAGDERYRQRFLRETRLAAELDHPNIVGVVTAGDEGGFLYLAMELVEGADLRTLLGREGRLELPRALAIVSQIADALDAAHEAGLVHRDVKPANILLEGDHAFICDFGLARHVSSVSSLTTERGFVGTIDYIAPEQIEGGTIDGRADVYALACVLFECLAGRRPFERESDVATVFAHLNEPPPRHTEQRPDLSHEFDAVFALALAKAPRERYSSCGELAAAARAASQGRTSRRPRMRPTRAALAAVAVTVTALAIAVTLLATYEPARAPAHAVAAISERSIAGASLGLERSDYRRLFGGHPAKGNDTTTGKLLPYLSWYGRRLVAYFGRVGPAGGGAFLIDTWNRRYRTAAGVGPCTSIARLKAVYGKRLKPSAPNTLGGRVYAYTLGSHLIFAANAHPPDPAKHVTSVALYSGGLRQDGYAGYLAISGFGGGNCN
jgi:serine/threonine-protein kinase